MLALPRMKQESGIQPHESHKPDFHMHGPVLQFYHFHQYCMARVAKQPCLGHQFGDVADLLRVGVSLFPLQASLYSENCRITRLGFALLPRR